MLDKIQVIRRDHECDAPIQQMLRIRKHADFDQRIVRAEALEFPEDDAARIES